MMICACNATGMHDEADAHAEAVAHRLSGAAADDQARPFFAAGKHLKGAPVLPH